MSEPDRVGAREPLVGRRWIEENRVSSYDMSIDVPISAEDLHPTSFDLMGRRAIVDGMHSLDGNFLCGPFRENSNVTMDCFDQMKLFMALTGIQNYLGSLGYDVEAIIGANHRGEYHPAVGHANAVSDFNAWFSLQSEQLTFGTAHDEWHLCSDDDISIHEFGHYLLHHLNRNLSNWHAGEGGAIHEGFGDALAALYHDDPEISEDFPPARGKPDDPTKGLRTVENDLTLKEVGEEVHSRGRVYGGFFWSIKKCIYEDALAKEREGLDGAEPKLERKLMLSRWAADITTQILINHAIFYSSTEPDSEDFVRAVMTAVNAMAGSGRLPVQIDQEWLIDVVKAEAKERGMIGWWFDKLNPVNLEKLEPFDPEAVIDLYEGKSMEVFYMDAGGVMLPSAGMVFMQEYATLPDGDILKVLGAGVMIFKDMRGNSRDISGRSMRMIKTGNISSEVNYTSEVALDIVKVEAIKREHGSRREKVYLEDEYARTGPVGDLFERLAKAQMRHRIDVFAKGMLDVFHPSVHELVILPDESDVYYEFKMGLSLYYVNRRTGELKVYDDVKWDSY